MRIAKSEQTREGYLAVLAEHSTAVQRGMLNGKVGLRLVEPMARRGSEAQATHCREGEAGHDDLLKGTTGGTPRPQTVSPNFSRVCGIGVSHLKGSIVMRQTGCRLFGFCLGKRVRTEEPDEGNLQVRVCGGSAG